MRGAIIFRSSASRPAAAAPPRARACRTAARAQRGTRSEARPAPSARQLVEWRQSNTDTLQPNTGTLQPNTGTPQLNTGTLRPNTGTHQSNTSTLQPKTALATRWTKDPQGGQGRRANLQLLTDPLTAARTQPAAPAPAYSSSLQLRLTAPTYNSSLKLRPPAPVALARTGLELSTSSKLQHGCTLELSSSSAGAG